MKAPYCAIEIALPAFSLVAEYCRDGLRVDEWGLETLGLAFEAIQDHAERRMRAAISALPAGTGGLSSISDIDGVVSRDIGHRDLGPYRLDLPIKLKIASIAASAKSASWSGVRFCTGCATQTMAGSKPSDLDCAAAAGLNASEITAHPGMPRRSRAAISCKLHDVHEPQSARPSTTTSQWATMSCRIGSGDGLV